MSKDKKGKKDRSEFPFPPEQYMTAEDYDRSDEVPPEITPGREFADIDGANPKFRENHEYGKDIAGRWQTPKHNTETTYGVGDDHAKLLEKDHTDTFPGNSALTEGTSDASGNFVGESDEHLSEGEK